MNSLRHSVGDPEYVAENWQGTLFVFAMILVIYMFNVYTANMMPLLDNLLMILHILSWAVVVIVLWAMAPHQSGKTVFITGWANLGGWSSMGLSVMIGQISAIYDSLSMYQLSQKDFALFWSLWPSATSVSLDDFNWSVVIFGGVFIISLVMYLVKGRKEYSGPVAIVKRQQ